MSRRRKTLGRCKELRKTRKEGQFHSSILTRFEMGLGAILHRIYHYFLQNWKDWLKRFLHVIVLLLIAIWINCISRILLSHIDILFPTTRAVLNTHSFGEDLIIWKVWYKWHYLSVQMSTHFQSQEFCAKIKSPPWFPAKIKSPPWFPAKIKSSPRFPAKIKSPPWFPAKTKRARSNEPQTKCRLNAETTQKERFEQNPRKVIGSTLRRQWTGTKKKKIHIKDANAIKNGMH